MLCGRVSPAKEPAEKFPVFIDFAGGLDATAGEALASAVVTSKRQSDGADSSGTFLLGTYTISGTKIVQRIQAGLDDEVHVVQIRATTNAGNVLEGELEVPIREV